MNGKILELLHRHGITPAPGVDNTILEKIYNKELKWPRPKKVKEESRTTKLSTMTGIVMMRRQLNAELRQLQNNDSSSTRARVELILRSAGRYDDNTIQALISAIRTKLDGG